MNPVWVHVVAAAMFFLTSLLPVPRLHAPDRLLAGALDASLAEPARVALVRALHGVRAERLADVARVLLPIVNEPLWWLPSEVLSLASLVRPRVLLGAVDGRIVAAPTPAASLVADAAGALWCADIGRVVLPRDVHALRERVPRLPWLEGTRGDL